MSCPYCVRAKAIMGELVEAGKATGEFIDMIEQNITKEDIAAKYSIEVRTVPQVFVDGKHVGGCDKFVEFLTNQGIPFNN